MIDGLSALAGVVLGALLTMFKDWIADFRNRRRHALYASIRIVCTLDELVDQCATSVVDRGEPDPTGDVILPSADPPQIPKFADDIDWKSLKPEVTYNVLSLADKVRRAQALVNFAFNELSFPPDNDEGFEEIRSQYSKIGLEAHQLTAELRRAYRLPEREQRDWDPIQWLREAKQRVERAGTSPPPTDLEVQDP